MSTVMESGHALEAVRAALTASRGRLLTFVRRRAGALVDAEDILQLAAERALARSSQLRDPSRVEAWLGRVVRNVLADELRRLRLTQVDIQEMELAAPEPEEEPCRCALALMHTLQPAYADILTRVLVHGVPVTKAAQEMGITANNAMVRLHRARQALQARLREHCGTTSMHSCQVCRCTIDGCCEVSA
jgi:RNA polymerase sigma-70 factor, ECF subfamily